MFPQLFAYFFKSYFKPDITKDNNRARSRKKDPRTGIQTLGSYIDSYTF